ncbi:MAG TPA: CGNR zinc finger domain-containing protein [Jatrophihabitans sp.]|nr:CGNR zinc finger domain-containing protein [Jatrophihabitans sp.]
MLDREPGSALPLPLQFRFDAGSPALNLLATRGYRGSDAPVERLTSVSRLRDWLAGNDLPAVPVDGRGLAAAVELREAAYAVLAAQIEVRRPPRQDVRILGGWASRPRPGRGLRWADRNLAWDEPHLRLDDVLGDLARELAGHAVDGAAALRTCAADTCAMLYLDRSRGHRRRWCSMGRCGNQAKVAAHRARISL